LKTRTQQGFKGARNNINVNQNIGGIMMEFRKYQHIERLGKSEVQGILEGEVHIFYKIDGTNASVWIEDGLIQAGSRRRHLSEDKDNANFYKTIREDENILKYLMAHPNHRLFGEWLVPHSLKTYREDAWRQFYVFDVAVDTLNVEGGMEYLHYDTYREELEKFNINYIPAFRVLKNPTVESVMKCLEECGNYLVEDGKGKGEGIVLKNYGFVNKYQRQQYGKVVTNEFKEKHHKEMGATITTSTVLIEQLMIDKFLTEAFIEKEYAKIKLELSNDDIEFSGKNIPMLLGKIWHEFLTEEMVGMIKFYKNPTVNYRTLYGFTMRKIKATLKEVF
jgi:hypothetical protein